jgi:Superinfection immunity protein/Short C-terminal domain
MWYHHYHDGWFWGLGWGVMFLLLFPYFLPTIIAVLRRKTSAVGVFFLNLFLGWTFIGWVGALIWALSADRQPTIIVNNAPSSAPPPPFSPPPPPHNYTNVTMRKPAATQQDKIDQLRQLKQLLDDGVLTETEFNRQKAEILG